MAVGGHRPATQGAQARGRIVLSAAARVISGPLLFSGGPVNFTIVAPGVQPSLTRGASDVTR